MDPAFAAEMEFFPQPSCQIRHAVAHKQQKLNERALRFRKLSVMSAFARVGRIVPQSVNTLKNGWLRVFFRCPTIVLFPHF